MAPGLYQRRQQARIERPSIRGYNTLGKGEIFVLTSLMYIFMQRLGRLFSVVVFRTYSQPSSVQPLHQRRLLALAL